MKRVVLTLMIALTVATPRVHGAGFLDFCQRQFCRCQDLLERIKGRQAEEPPPIPPPEPPTLPPLEESPRPELKIVASTAPEILNPAKVVAMPSLAAWMEEYSQMAELNSPFAAIVTSEVRTLLPTHLQGQDLARVRVLFSGPSDHELSQTRNPALGIELKKIPENVLTLRAYLPISLRKLPIYGLAIGDTFYALRLLAWNSNPVPEIGPELVALPVYWRFLSQDRRNEIRWLRLQSEGLDDLPLGIANRGILRARNFASFVNGGVTSAKPETVWRHRLRGVWEYQNGFLILRIFIN